MLVSGLHSSKSAVVADRHQSHKGGRAWSEDSGTSWHYSYNTTSYPFSSTADDGTVIACLNTPSGSRGEPRVLIDQLTGLPTVLPTVCFNDDGPSGLGFYSRVLLQRINTLEEEDDGPVGAEMITVSVDDSRRRTPPLYGWSTEITVTDVADMQLAATTALTHASIARYPGGTPADYMDWRTGWHCVFSSLPIPQQTCHFMQHCALRARHDMVSARRPVV